MQLSLSEGCNHPVWVDETEPLFLTTHPNHRWKKKKKCCFCLVACDISCQMIRDIPWRSSRDRPVSLSEHVTLWKLLALRCYKKKVPVFSVDLKSARLEMKNAPLIVVCYPARSEAVVFCYLWRFPALSAMMWNQIAKPFFFPPSLVKTCFLV